MECITEEKTHTCKISRKTHPMLGLCNQKVGLWRHSHNADLDFANKKSTQLTYYQ